jgi:hypothetical protein
MLCSLAISKRREGLRMTTRVRQWLIVLSAVVLLTAAYAVAGFVGVPHLLRSQLLSFVADHYHRAASVGEIRFNPFTAALEVHDFTLPDADGQPMLAFGRLRINLGAATVWRAAPSFTDIELERPFVRTLLRKDGSLNLEDLAKPFESATPAPPPAPNEKPARLFVDRLSVRSGQTIYRDESRPSPFQARLEPITFELRDFSTTGKTGNEYSLTGASTSGERFAWNGSLRVAPLGSQGRFEVADLQAHTIWAYLRDSLAFELSSGQINLNGEYDFRASPEAGLNVNIRTVSISDLGVKPKGADTEYVQHANVQVDDTRLDLARARVDVGKIHLTGGTVHAWRDSKGAINLMELAAANTRRESDTASPAAASASTPGSPPPSQWVLAAPDIAVENLRLELEDRLVKPAARFTLSPISLNVHGYSTAPDAMLDLDASVRINDSGQLAARGRVAPESGAVSAHVDLKGFDLEAIQPYVNTYTQITLLSGILSTGLDIERAANGSLDIKGDTEVAKLRTVDNALRQDLVKWDRLNVEGMRYQSDPASLSIHRLTARAPYGRVIIAPDQSLNLTRALSPTPGSKPTPVQTVQTAEGKRSAPGGNPGAMQIRIDTVKITDASANFADFWIQPNYAVSLQSLSGTVEGLSSNPESRAKVSLAGKVDRYAPAQIGGEINLLSAALFTDMKVSFQGVEMNSVTPYSGHFAGYKIQKGKLSINVEYHVENRRLDAKQRFVVDQLQLGDPVESPDAVHLPLRLAVALLKDRNGVIDLDLPVTGSLDDPQFRLAPLVWKAVVGLLTKAVTAPFKLLGSLFGGGDEMNLVDFQPGAASLDPGDNERLASVAKALKERPQLELDVPASYSPDVDASTLAAQKLNEKLQLLVDKEATGKKGAGAPKLETILADPSRRFDLLLEQYRLDYGRDAEPPGAAAAAVLATPRKKVEPASLDAASEELTRAITAKQPVTESDLEQLGQARARAIQDALLGSGEVNAARVFTLGASATKPTDGKVRLALALKR